MEHRKGDARIYIITALLLVSLLTGGFLLSLYIFQPENQSAPWYPITGFILVGIPWIFWIVAYLYRCFVPHNVKVYDSNTSNLPATQPYTATPATAGTTATSASEYDRGWVSPEQTPKGGRQVHFGGVFVVGSGSNDYGSSICESMPDTDSSRHSSDSDISPDEAEILDGI
ncbi:hypothetical protein SLA2020_325490 [Shorea laevis]